MSPTKRTELPPYGDSDDPDHSRRCGEQIEGLVAEDC